MLCLADFVGMTLLALFFLLSLPNCFLRVCLLTLFAAVLKLFQPLTTSAISGTANSDKSAPTRFAAGTTSLRSNGRIILLITYGAPNLRPRCRPIELKNEVSTCPKATISLGLPP